MAPPWKTYSPRIPYSPLDAAIERLRVDFDDVQLD
jgi:hypothetical protein